MESFDTKEVARNSELLASVLTAFNIIENYQMMVIAFEVYVSQECMAWICMAYFN